MDLNINITVSLSEATLNVLRQFSPDMPEHICRQSYDSDEFQQKVADICYETVKQLAEAAKIQGQDEENARKEEPSSPQAPADQDPFLSPEQAPDQKEISDSELREYTKAAKDRKGAKAVREVFARFNIASSIECPQERRSDLVAALENVK